MKTLYVSDLDGTLLQSNERTSDYTNMVINKLTAKGMLFSYATARSLITAKKAAKGINAKIPLIVYNGAFIVDNVTGEILKANYFEKSSVQTLLDTLFKNGIYPIVYAYIDGKEKFSFIPGLSTQGMKKFTDSRKGDIRENIVDTPDELKAGDIFYITCIGEPEQLRPIYEKYRDTYHCVYQIDIYTDEQWLEIMPKEASKANAILQLKSMLQCDRVVAFGDGKNDIDMFEIADEGYAVSNAHEDLKEKATDVIQSNNEDGVAKWLEAMDSTLKFDGFAKDYAIGRPSYAPELINYLYRSYGISQSSVIADIGSGTGKFAKHLLEMGSQVYCVEPNNDMRQMAEKELGGYKNFHSVAGDAQCTNLDDGFVDFVTAAQAFHWFDVTAFRRECMRIMKRSGKVFLIWNIRDESDVVNQELRRIYEKYCPNFIGFNGGIKKDDIRIRSFFDDHYDYAAFNHPLHYDKDKFMSRSLSGSYSLKAGDKGFEDYTKEIKEIFNKYSKDGMLSISNQTVAYIGSLRREF